MRFKNSAKLFATCKTRMKEVYPMCTIKDGDVGRILGFDPTDTNHWKHGKRSIHSIYYIKQLSSALKMDMDTIIEINYGFKIIIFM